MAYLQNHFLHNSGNLVKEFFNKASGYKNNLSIISYEGGGETLQVLQLLW